MKENDIVFECNKCGHLFFITKDKTNTYSKLVNSLKGLIIADCPNCGEEPNWHLLRMGNYKEEYGKDDFYPGWN